MAKPRLIILVRHAQSEGNRNREIHQSTPDHRVRLTQEGWSQAHEAGRRMRNLLRPDDTIHFFTSPYRRTRETTEGILTTLTSDDQGPSPFRRANIKVYEEPRLREQDFGNFQPCSAEMERMWQERADYGHFFYRIPNGESAADAYDRVSGFNESLWRQFGEDDFASVCVLVTHGLMSRVFLMKWYHFSVEYFEDLRNINHCEFLVMRKQDNGKYLLENRLRTWSELRRERALKEAREGGKDRDGGDPAAVAERLGKVDKPSTTSRRWGGCPNGCNHSRHYVKKREDLELLRQSDNEHAVAATAITMTGSDNTNIAAWRQKLHQKADSNDGDVDEEDHDDHDDDNDSNHDRARAAPPPAIEIIRAKGTLIDDPPSSPELLHHTPSSSSQEPSRSRGRLHVGRDGGGTYSGHASTAGSDTEVSEDEHHHHHPLHRHSSSNSITQQHRRVDSLNARICIANAESLQSQLERAASTGREASGSGDVGGSGSGSAGEFAANLESTETTIKHACINRLGDAPPPPPRESELGSSRRSGSGDGDDGEDELEDLDKAEKEDKSLRGSVY